MFQRLFGRPLSKIVPPPIRPVETGTPSAWEAVEKQLGVRLPTDYKAFIDVYGSGLIGGVIWVWNPFSQNEDLNLLQMIPTTLKIEREFKVEFGQQAVPYSLYPDRGGLLPWGHTDTGALLFWLMTDPNPDHWLVIMNEVRGNGYEPPLRESMTTYLANFVSGTLRSPHFPSGTRNYVDRTVPFLPLNATSQHIPRNRDVSQPQEGPAYPGGYQARPDWVRAQLLGKALGGVERDLRNLVMLYRDPVNSPSLRRLDMRVALAAEAGEDVQYLIVPIYRGSELVPIGLTVQAIGDKGLNIQLSLLNRK